MTKIYLIRHAQADGNLYRRCQAWYDGLITPTGYRQIEALEQRFRDVPIDAAYSSDLFRTMTTAGAICRSHRLPLHTDPQLREIRSGRWEDRPWGDLLRTERDSLLAFWRCDPAWQVEGSETFGEIQHRFDTAVRRIAAAHPGQTVAVFAHGCIIRSAIAYWLGTATIREIPHGDNTCVALLECDGRQVHVKWYNNIDHLSGDLANAPHPAAKTDEETASGIERTSLYFRPEARGEALAAMLGDRQVGSLKVDARWDAAANAGYISFLNISPELRRRRLGVQLLGQAVSLCRASGRDRIRLECGEDHPEVQSFCRKYGFYQLEGAVWEKDIRCNHPSYTETFK
ncbi:MAG: bifunctional histidine phosphatase family protein/GNAT family N-acetyltransferase [Oscillospiraceae bacterium]|nr:bifunctional histidine phosphatase family protein/GNAT family N-acetyltransferase [Oscillospiraceae bacterium]